jgi:hypothetical protein
VSATKVDGDAFIDLHVKVKLRPDRDDWVICPSSPYCLFPYSFSLLSASTEARLSRIIEVFTSSMQV